MTQLRFSTAVALLLSLAAAVSSQPGKAPPIIKFKQFGSTPEQFYQSSVTRWTGQLALNLETMKAEIAKARVTPAARTAINGHIDHTLGHVADLDRLIRRGGNADKVAAEFAEVEKSLTALSAAINHHPVARQATATTLVQADHAHQHLAETIGAGDTDPTRGKRRLIRLAETIDDNGEELRTLIADNIAGNDRALDRAIGQYARESRLLGRRVRDGADADLIKRTYEAMDARLTDVTTLLGRVRGVPAAVQTQLVRVHALHRRMAPLIGAAPGGGNPIPQLPGVKRFAFAVGADAGAQPHVTVFADEKGTIAHNFFAYDKAFDGGVRVDMADLNGDGVPDLIAAPGPSRGNVVMPVRVYDGRDLSLLVEFIPFPNWKGGVHIAASSLTRDGRALIAVTAEGTQHVKIFDLAKGKEIDSFFAHDKKATGGVRLAWGDMDGDGVPDLVTVNGPGNITTTVKAFDGKNGKVIAEFPVLDRKYTGGAFVAAADVTGNGRANMIVGLDGGNVPAVRIFDAKGKALVEWLAYDERFRGGVRVAVSAGNHVVTAPGSGLKNSLVRIFDTGRVKAPVAEFVPFPGYGGGLSIGGR